jgi:hypothetical protein
MGAWWLYGPYSRSVTSCNEYPNSPRDRSLRLLARWMIFATPLVSVARLLDDAVGRLKGYIMCAAEGGTLAIIGVDELEM